MVRNCTATSDRVCRSCSSCADGFYMQAPCSGYQDTACAGKDPKFTESQSSDCNFSPMFFTPGIVCSTCGYGSYIRTPCAAKADTVCAACNSCGRLQYAARSCERGLDVICNSCESCSFADPAVQEACESDKAYFPWQRANCCKGPKGDKVRLPLWPTLTCASSVIIVLILLLCSHRCRVAHWTGWRSCRPRSTAATTGTSRPPRRLSTPCATRAFASPEATNPNPNPNRLGRCRQGGCLVGWFCISVDSVLCSAAPNTLLISMVCILMSAVKEWPLTAFSCSGQRKRRGARIHWMS